MNPIFSIKNFLRTAIAATALSGFLSCGLMVGGSGGNEACYAENYCDTATTDCYMVWGLFQDLMGTDGDSSSGGDEAALETVFVTEASDVPNNVFSGAEYFALPDADSNTGLSGLMDAAGDVDIFYGAYTSGPTVKRSFDFSIPINSDSTCDVYGTFGPSLLSTDVADSSLTYLGTLYPLLSPLTVTLNLDEQTHVYIKCSGGAAGTGYSVLAQYSTSSDSTDDSGTDDQSGIDAFMDYVCATATQSCKDACDNGEQ